MLLADHFGRPELLLLITGTIPATISDTVYRIPVDIWVPKNFPKSPPTTFVTPTADMLIHPGNYVDTNGRCYHPYIARWPESPDVSLSLTDLFGVVEKFLSTYIFLKKNEITNIFFFFF